MIQIENTCNRGCHSNHVIKPLFIFLFSMKKFLFTFLAIIIVAAGYFLINRNIVKVNTVPAGWLTYTGNGIEFQYPGTFGANVWRAVTWPPTVTAVPADKDPVAFGCPKLKDSAMITES